MTLAEALDVLGLPSPGDAAGSALPTTRDLRRAYRRASLAHHPDRNRDDPAAATKRFQRVGAAYQRVVRAVEGGGDDDGGDNDAEDEEDAQRRKEEEEDDDDDETTGGYGMDNGRVDGAAWDYEHDLPAWACHGRETRDEQDQNEDDLELELLRRQLFGEDGEEDDVLPSRGDRRFFQRMQRKHAFRKRRRERLARERRMEMKARERKDKSDAAFWARQRRCGSRELSLGGSGCYLHWHPRKLQREVSRRQLPTTIRPAGAAEPSDNVLAWILLEDDERKFAEGGMKMLGDTTNMKSNNGSGGGSTAAAGREQMLLAGDVPTAAGGEQLSTTGGTTTDLSVATACASGSSAQRRNPIGEASLPPAEAARRKIIAARERMRLSRHPSQLAGRRASSQGLFLQDPGGASSSGPAATATGVGGNGSGSALGFGFGLLGDMVGRLGQLLGVVPGPAVDADDDRASLSSSLLLLSEEAAAAAERRRQAIREEELAVAAWREEQRRARDSRRAARRAAAEREQNEMAALAATREAERAAERDKATAAAKAEAAAAAATALRRAELDAEWPAAMQAKLNDALRRFPADGDLPKKERWRKIAELVGKSRKQCHARFKQLREQLREEQARTAAEATARADALASMTPTERAKLERAAARKKHAQRRAQATR